LDDQLFDQRVGIEQGADFAPGVPVADGASRPSSLRPRQLDVESGSLEQGISCS